MGLHTANMESPESPPLKGDRVVDRIVVFHGLTGLTKSAFGKHIGRSGYGLIQSWVTGKRNPSLRMINRVVGLARQLGYTYTANDFMDGTEDQRRGNIPEDEPPLSPAEELEADSLDRGEAYIWIEDRDGLTDAVRQKLRELVGRYPQRAWTIEYLTGAADFAMTHPEQSPIDVHRAAEETRLASEAKHDGPVDLAPEPTAAEPGKPKRERRKSR